MSLSQEPTLAFLKRYFVCGYKDITNEPYSGVSGVHEVNSNAVDTTNGAGPHNLQLFFLSADGTVLNVLPGYWHGEDLYPEMQLAARLNAVWLDPHLSRTQKDQLFSKMQLDHIKQHSQAMMARSSMQGFDMQYEAKNNPGSDCIKPEYASEVSQMALNGWKTMGVPLKQMFKTTDEIMHERMASRPFEPYQQFDVASFANYGKHIYDKHENDRDETGRMVARRGPQPELGNAQAIAEVHPNRAMQQQRQMMQQQMRMNRGMWGTPAYGNGGAPMPNGYNNGSGGWGTGPQWGN